MAKKSKMKYAATDVAQPAGGDYKPCLYLDFQGADTKQLQGLAVGDDVYIILKGKIKGVSQRERTDYDDPKKIVKTGTIDLSEYDVEVFDNEKNPYSELAGDD